MRLCYDLQLFAEIGSSKNSSASHCFEGSRRKTSKQDYRAPTRVILRGALGWARVLGVAGCKSNLKRLYIHTRRHYALSAPHFCMAHFPNPNSDLARPPRLLFLLTGTPGAKFRRPAGGRARETGPIFESRHTKTKKEANLACMEIFFRFC